MTDGHLHWCVVIYTFQQKASSHPPSTSPSRIPLPHPFFPLHVHHFWCGRVSICCDICQKFGSDLHLPLSIVLDWQSIMDYVQLFIIICWWKILPYLPHCIDTDPHAYNIPVIESSWVPQPPVIMSLQSTINCIASVFINKTSFILLFSCDLS